MANEKKNNKFALFRGQAIIGISDGLVYWRVYASNGLNQ